MLALHAQVHLRSKKDHGSATMLSLHEAILLRTSSRGLSQGIKDAKVKLIQGQGGKEKFSP